MHGSVMRSRCAALPVAVALLLGVVVVAASRATPVSAAGWDYIYGDPGPSNYSRYQDVAIAADGTTYVTGFYSGSFRGLSSPDAYRYFLQRVDTDGTVAWTVEVNTSALPTLSIPFAPDLIVDGLGNPILQVALGNPGSSAQAWYVFDGAGSLVSSRAAQGNWDSYYAVDIAAASAGGFVAIVDTMAPKLQYFDAHLSLQWEFPLAALIDGPGYCAYGCGSVPDVTSVSDGTFWVVSRKSRTLATQQDALSMVHISATGSQIAAIKYNGLRPADGTGVNGVIVGSSASFLWLNVDSGAGSRVMSFAASDGHLLGDVPTILPAEEIATPYGVRNCGGLDFSSVSSDPIGTSIYRQQVLVNGTRLIVVARCREPSGSDANRTTMLLSYSMSGALGGNYSLTASRAMSPTASIYAMDADAAGNAVVVGATTDGNVYAGSIETIRTNALTASATNEQAVAARNPLGNLIDLAEFKAVLPARLFDTRPTEPNAAVVVAKQLVGPADVLTVKVAGKLNVPANGASAVSLNVTVVDPAGSGFVTVFPCGTRPLASNLNYTAGQTVANAVIAPLAPSGDVCLYSSSPTHLLADVNGWFRAGLGFNAVTPLRLFDTRSDQSQGAVPVAQQKYGGTTELRVKVTGVGDVPSSNVGAVSLNVTAVSPEGPGFVTVYPCGDRPLASNLNFTTGQTVPNSVITPVSPSGEVCLFSNVNTDLLADVNGWFASGSSFNALSPVRLMDTRPDQAQGAVAVAKQKYGGASMLTVRVAAAAGVPSTGVSAVSLNVTVVDPDSAGFVTVFPCGTQPLASNVNFAKGQTVPNSVIAPISASGDVCFFANTDAHLLADINGWISS